jgi:hypothetical protein
LIAVAMFPGGLADTENTWGIMTLSLLAPGLLGLMLSGMLLGHMPSVGSNAISVAALIGRNIYEPLVKGRSQAHYLRVGQIAVVGTLAASLAISAFSSGAVKLITNVITLNAFFGAIVLLIVFWRRLSVPAVWISFILWIGGICLPPSVVPLFEGARRAPALLEKTQQRTISAVASATAQDVAAGLAGKAGDPIQKSVIIPPAALYFESVARLNPDDPHSPLEGVGRFQVEVYLLHLCGFPVNEFNRAGILAARWLVDGLLPFIMAILFSYLVPGARPTEADRRRIDCFYAKLKTPIAPTPEKDEIEVALTYQDPHRFDHKTLFPGSSWEFTTWEAADWIGFLGCWGVVALILGFLWLVLNVGA